MSYQNIPVSRELFNALKKVKLEASIDPETNEIRDVTWDELIRFLAEKAGIEIPEKQLEMEEGVKA